MQLFGGEILNFVGIIKEFLIDVWFSIVGHKRDKTSFERRKNIYKPLKEFLTKITGIKFRDKDFKESNDTRSLSRKVVSLIFFLLIILLVRHSVIEPYKIPTGSMIPTMKIGDHLFVNKLTYGLRIPFLGEVYTWANPNRGDIVIFDPPLDNGKIYVKRIVGLPGDTIKVEDTRLFINGVEIIKESSSDRTIMNDVMDQEKYSEANYKLYVEDYFGLKHYVLQYINRDYLYAKFNFEIKVPEGKYFMMGDNRDNSEDSRVWGFVPRDQIYGRVMFVWLSLNWNKAFTSEWIRYSRFGKFIK